MLKNCSNSTRKAGLEISLGRAADARAYARILKVARTIADLEDYENIQPIRLSEAIQHRFLDRNFIA